MKNTWESHITSYQRNHENESYPQKTKLVIAWLSPRNLMNFLGKDSGCRKHYPVQLSVSLKAKFLETKTWHPLHVKMKETPEVYNKPLLNVY